MCLQLCFPTTEGGASRLSEESIHTKYQNALKTTSFERFCEEVRRRIDGDLQQLLLPTDEFIKTHVLQQYTNKPDLLTFLSQYFSNTQNAFELCSRLLKNTHHARINYRAIRDINFRLQSAHFDIPEEECRRIREDFKIFVDGENPFGQTAELDEICSSLDELNDFPDLRSENKSKHLWFAEKQRAEVDDAAWEIYLLKNHLKTTRVLARGLYDDIENAKSKMGICLAREDEVYPLQLVGLELGKNDGGFLQRLDEIEEQGCLCLRKINRARTLLLQFQR